MSRYQFTPQAVDDLFEIWCYIARDSVEFVDLFRHTAAGGVACP
jgi:hypothetical protein